ncbi:MAG TPA: hypothetical protein VMM78_12655 [Thermomicrobiales bacterium]|nr:hypothetical protein [Thermomicrobiales bacterium]
MVARHVEQFTVATSEDLADLEACLNEQRVESALVEIPDGSTALLNAREFRRVVRLAREHAIEIAFATDDPLRRELARIVGGRLTADPIPRPDPLPDAETRKLDGNRAAPVFTRIAAGPPSFRPWQRDTRAEDIGSLEIEFEHSNPSFSFVVSPPKAARVGATGQMSPSPHDPLHEVWEGYAPPDPLFHRSQRAAPRKRTRRGAARRVIATLMVAATVFISGLLVSIVVVPSATIQLTPATQMHNAVVTYGIALSGEQFDVTIQPEPINVVLSFEEMIPTTGVRGEPDAAASGTILLTNTSTVDIVVPAGATFISATGVAFLSSDDAIVPAADPFGALTVGSTTIQVSATTPGPDGNVGPAVIQGQLDSGVYYTNRDAFTGGTMREIAVVSPDDIATLRQRAENDLNARAATAIDFQLAPGQTLIDGTTQREAIQYTFDHEAGDDAQVVRVRASLALSASTFQPSDAHEQARAEVSGRLAASVEPNTTIIPSSISIGEPRPVDESHGMAFTIAASATTRAVIDPADIEQLETDLVGLSADQAVARIQQVKGVDAIDVQYKRDWFGERMPRLQSRISIEVLDATGISSQATSSGR